MKRRSIEDLELEYLGKSYGWLTVIGVYRDSRSALMFNCQCKCGKTFSTRKDYVLSGHTTSCGCYRCSSEKSDKFKQWCKNNPDKIADQALRYSQWCKDNPDKVKEKTEKRKKTIEENPYTLQLISEKNKLYWSANPDKFADRCSKQAISLYTSIDHSYLENYRDIIHPDDYAVVFDKPVPRIRIKCPVCGKYAPHSFCNVFTNNSKGLKPGRHIPMCSSCR